MKLKIIAVTIVILCAANGLFAQEKTSKTSRDEAMIRGIVEQVVKGWNVKSGAEFARPFAEDVGLRRHQRNARQRSRRACRRASANFRHNLQRQQPCCNNQANPLFASRCRPRSHRVEYDV